MKKTLIILSGIYALSACGAGGSTNNDPKINVSVINNSCSGLTNNKTCSIKVDFNNGVNNNPVLNYALNPELSPGIAPSRSDINYNSDPFVQSIRACQVMINSTPNRVDNNCIITFNYKTQGGKGTNSILGFDLNGIHSNILTIQGD